MSMRPRGAATGARRSRLSTAPVYEDFKPTFEWKHDEGASILLYHLPGFSKEQIRIVADSKGTLRVRGERLVTSNRWSRFQEEVMVPQDCNISEVRAKFESGILQITMPKKTTTIHKETVVEQKQPNSNDQHTTFRQPPNTPKPVDDLEQNPQPRLQDPLPSTLPSSIPRNDGQNVNLPFDLRQSQNNQYDEGKVTKDEKEKEKHDKYVDALGDQEKGNFHEMDKNHRFDDSKSESKGQLLINMGVAILVIVALGSQIYYSFDSNA